MVGGLVGWGGRRLFLETAQHLGVLGGEKRVGEHADDDVVVPGGPGPDLVVVQPEKILFGFVVLFSHPLVVHLNLAMRSLVGR